MIAPTLRSRLGQPSSRLPIPGANALSTVEWQSAQVTPTCVSVSLPLTVSTVPLSPTTASSFSKATVVSGLFRSTLPLRIAPCNVAGGASTSTLRPTDSAVAGSTEVRMTSCMRKVSVHLVSSPKVSARKICCPCPTWSPLSELPPHALSNAAAAATTDARRRPCLRWMEVIGSPVADASSGPPRKAARLRVDEPLDAAAFCAVPARSRERSNALIQNRLAPMLIRSASTVVLNR